MSLITIANSSKYIKNYIIFLCLAISISVCLPSQVNGDERVIARVDGDKILKSEIDILINNISNQALSVTTQQLRNILLRELINNKIVAKIALKNGLDKSMEYLVLSKISNERMLNDLFMKQKFEEIIDESLLKKKYNNFLDKYSGQEEIRARHILLKSEEEALKIFEKLQQGEDFISLAKNNSIGPSANIGGDLGYFTKGTMVKEFSDVAYKLKLGEISKPVRSEFGWHIIKLSDRREIEPPGFNQVKKSLIVELKEELKKEIITIGKNELKVVIIDMENYTYE